MIAGMSSMRDMVPFHLTKLSKMLEGTSCWISRPMLPRGMLPHEEQDRDVVGVGPGDAGQGVGGAGGPGAGEGHADLPGGAGVAVGDLDAHALVAGGEDGYLLRRPQGRPEGGLAAASEPGDVSDSFLFQSVDYCVAASHGRSPNRSVYV